MPLRYHADVAAQIPAIATKVRGWLSKATSNRRPRIHDLRHSFASIAASSGASLPLIAALLMHTQAATTQRYAHLLDDAQRAVTDRVGAIVDADNSAEIVRLRKA
jgi:site-specific recombinase XerD